MPIVLKDLSFSYFSDRVLQDVSVTLGEGLVHLLLGPTGSGKTTLALILTGLLKPQGGCVLIDGCDPASKGFERSKVQLAFQFPEAQIFEMTVERELEFGLRNFGFEPGERRRRCEWALGCVGLGADIVSRDPSSLSFGERRKVALASVIALKPKYLILDEPLAGLDWHGRQSLIVAVKRLKDENLTTVLLTHETDVVAEIGDTVSIVVENSVSKPVSVSDFLYPDRDPGHELLPDFVVALRRIQAAGFPVEGRPRRVEDVARALVAALGFNTCHRI